MPRFIISIGLVLSVVVAQAATLRYVAAQQATPNALIVDTRARAACEQRSLAGAHCLPATDLIGPHGELPSFADIFWALGTAGLDGSETILVTGDKPAARDFVAGLLYLCGQAKVEILNSPIAKVLRTGRYRAGEGQVRGILRQRIYHARMRDRFLVLPGELSRTGADDEHLILINAASVLPATPHLADLNQKRRKETAGSARFVVYARQPRDAIVLFTRLLAARSAQANEIRVVPVAAHGMLSAVAGPGKYLATADVAVRIAITTKGGKQWI